MNGPWWFFVEHPKTQHIVVLPMKIYDMSGIQRCFIL